MLASDLVERLLVGGAAALLFAGVATALLSPNMLKRLVGSSIAMLGTLAGLAALDAPDSVLVAGVAVLFAQFGVGIAIVVRTQEAYASLEAPEIDAADEDSERDVPR